MLLFPSAEEMLFDLLNDWIASFGVCADFFQISKTPV
jgi:hypothetical protein